MSDEPTQIDPANDDLINTAGEVSQAFGSGYTDDPLDGDRPSERLELKDILEEEEPDPKQ